MERPEGDNNDGLDLAVVKLVVLAIAGITGLAVAGTVVLIALGHKPPEIMGWVISGGCTLLLGIPINTRKRSR